MTFFAFAHYRITAASLDLEIHLHADEIARPRFRHLHQETTFLDAHFISDIERAQHVLVGERCIFDQLFQ